MAANRPVGTRLDDPVRRGTWVGVECAEEGCAEPVSCKALCRSHYNKRRWMEGHRPPSTDPDSRRTARIKHRYGIGPDEYAALHSDQGGRCAICREVPEAAGSPAHWAGKLCIDHDHATGVVRGLLCNDCNLIVKKHFTATRLRAAADYLERHA